MGDTNTCRCGNKPAHTESTIRDKYHRILGCKACNYTGKPAQTSTQEGTK